MPAVLYLLKNNKGPFLSLEKNKIRMFNIHWRNNVFEQLIFWGGLVEVFVILFL